MADCCTNAACEIDQLGEGQRSTLRAVPGINIAMFAIEVNMRSVWLCSRHDIIANTSVPAAAAGVWLTHSQWPDLLTGLGIATLFLQSSLQVLRDAARTYRAHKCPSRADSDTIHRSPR